MKTKEEFWNSNFSKEQVNVDKFINKLSENFGIDNISSESTEYKHLELLFAESSIVDKQIFFEVVDSFDSFQSSRFLPSVFTLCSSPFFFGRVSTKDSEKILSNQASNVAIIRFSSSVGDLSVSVVIKSEIFHFRIFHQSGSKLYKPYKFKSGVSDKEGSLLEMLKLIQTHFKSCPNSGFDKISQNSSPQFLDHIDVVNYREGKEETIDNINKKLDISENERTVNKSFSDISSEISDKKLQTSESDKIKIEELQKQIEELNQQILYKDKSIQNQTFDLEELQKKHETDQSLLLEKEDQISLLQSELEKKHEGGYSEKEKVNGNCNEDNLNKSDSSNILSLKENELISLFDEMSSQLESASNEVSYKEKEILKLREELENKTFLFSQHQQNSVSLKDFDEISLKFNDLNNLFNNKVIEFNSSQLELKKKDEDIKRLENELKDNISRSNSLSKNVDELTLRVQELTLHLSQKESEIDHLSQKSSSLQQKLEDSDKKCNLLIEENKQKDLQVQSPQRNLPRTSGNNSSSNNLNGNNPNSNVVVNKNVGNKIQQRISMLINKDN